MKQSSTSLRKRRFRALLVVLGVFLIIALVGPFLVPIPRLKDTVPPEQLADRDSRFVEVNDLRVHYEVVGSEDSTLILLHGFGANVFSWRKVTEPLSDAGTVMAFDRPAFGLTERPLSWPDGANPYSPDAQVELLIALMDAMGTERAILVGNSAGGTVAVNAALTHPERFVALVLVDAAIYEGGGAPSWVRPFLHLPQVDRLGPLLARQIAVRGDAFLEAAWHDPGRITAEDRAGYRKPLRVENWDRALWQFTKASRAPRLEDQIRSVTLPSLVVSGDDDRLVPVESSVRLAEELPNAELTVIPDCGHLPHEECPAAFLDAVLPFVRRVLE
ncbi:MAG: alpha/beta hydrolase [Anaerolineae bacterium]|jgi:pimeloyl-ACP methyl ester carboxylesterase